MTPSHIPTDELERLAAQIPPESKAIISLVQKGFLPLRTCAICGGHIGYQIHPYYLAVVFNSACGCGGGGESYRPVDRDEWSKFAATITAGDRHDD